MDDLQKFKQGGTSSVGSGFPGEFTFSGHLSLFHHDSGRRQSVSVERLAREYHGVVRFSGNAEAKQRFGAGLVSAFREQNTGITFELQIDIAWDKEQLPLEAGKSNVALRPLDEISSDTLVAKKVAEFPLGVYCSRTYKGAHGSPQDSSGARDHKFLVYSEDIASVMKSVRLLNVQLDPSRVLYQVNAVSSMAAAIQSVDAVGLLPCVTGDATPDLVQWFRHEQLYYTLWLIASRESYGRPEVKKFMAFAGTHFKGAI